MTSLLHGAEDRQTAPQIAELNRRYLDAVTCRALCHAATVNGWQGQTVSVFLRHESDHVFAIAGEQQFGMADFVAIDQAVFHVDERGRQQACRGEGLLPNGRNVHAFVRGRLLWAAMHSVRQVPEDWQSIVYNPHRMRRFEVQATGQPIDQADEVLFTPDPLRVRCLVPSVRNSTEASR